MPNWVQRCLLPFILMAGLSVAAAQVCDDLEACTGNDSCVEGQCLGTLLSGTPCDDGDPCTVSDQCARGSCRGELARDGTICRGGCGSCSNGRCVANSSVDGRPCDDNLPCTVNETCHSGVCFGELIQCADVDGDPCTSDRCNPVNGRCEHSNESPCPSCQSCVVTSSGFTCEPMVDGSGCDDRNECTGDGTCSDGQCRQGAPLPPPATCPADCDRDGAVSVDEIIAAVNIGLGNVDLARCPAVDTSGDGVVTVEEIVVAVNSALAGC